MTEGRPHAFWGDDPSGYCGCSDCTAEESREPEFLDDDYDILVQNGVIAMEGMLWFLGKCRESGAIEWHQVEQILWSKPGCNNRITAAIRAAWEMQL